MTDHKRGEAEARMPTIMRYNEGSTKMLRRCGRASNSRAMLATSPARPTCKEVDVANIAWFDPDRFYLGVLCARGHEWGNTSQSLRTFRRQCVTCKEIAERNRPPRDVKTKWLRRITAVNETKLSQGCYDCGYKDHPAALHFDHLPGYEKIRDVSQMIVNASWDALMAEINKCEVVCANCHAIRTADRRAARQIPESNGKLNFREGQDA